MEKIVVLVFGILVIGFIIYWFFGKRQEKATVAQVADNHQNIDIEVNGGYSPEVVVLKQGVPAQLNFTRKDASTCLDHVVFPEFGINQALPQNKQQSIEIDTSQPGEYQWACGMDMFHGKLVIK